MTKLEEKLGFKTRFKYCEEMGRSIREMAVRKDPDPQACGRPNCFLANQNLGGAKGEEQYTR